MTMSPTSTRTLNWVLGLLLLAMMALSAQLIRSLQAHQALRSDLAEVNNIKYGMLSADAWVTQVTAIIEKKIQQFRLTPENRAAIKPTLEQMLEVLITAADRHMRQQAIKGGWWERTTNKVKENIRDSFISIDEIKAGVPAYADQILDELNKPSTRQQVDVFLKKMLEDLSVSTFALVDDSAMGAVRARYGCHQREACQQAIQQQIEANYAVVLHQTFAVLALTALLFAAVLFAPGKSDKTLLALLALCCATLMLCGTLTPMIEVEARISELKFALLGEPVVFTDQLLYFQTKSVIDVAWLLMTNGKLQMIFVGLLVVLFSVIFPLAKLAASLVYLYDAKSLRRSPVIQFFALKSGKWSMADVFVVAMFMAYIGFDGMASNQLATFVETTGTAAQVLTTNGTTLEIGFFMFLAFCLTSMATSSLIEARCAADVARET